MRLAPIPPTTAARCRTSVGRASRNRRAAAARSRKSYSALRGTTMFRQPRALIVSTTNEPRNPAPPVTTTRWSCQKLMMSGSLILDCGDLAGQAVFEGLHVGLDHDLHQLLELHLRLPSQPPLRLARVPHQDVDFGRAKVALVELDIPPPVEPHQTEGLLAELLDGMCLARRDDVVIGTVLLEDEPHGFGILGRVAPVTLGLEIAEIDLLLQARLDVGDRPADLARHEGLATPRRLVVEQDAVGGEQAVALPVIHRRPEGKDFRHAVRAARVERGRLALRDLDDLAEHLAR